MPWNAMQLQLVRTELDDNAGHRYRAAMARHPGSTIPRYKRRRRDGRSWPRRIFGWIVKLIVAFFVISFLWVLAYRFVNPPITFTMMSDILAGRGADRKSTV